MSPNLLNLLSRELDEIRSRIDWAESSQNPSDFISARLAVGEAENTLSQLQKEVKVEAREGEE